MAELRKPTSAANPPLRQVVFVHGLNGDKVSTWTARNDVHVFWPDWLVEDAPGTVVWSVGYAASPTHWQRDGSAMALPDRAANVLPSLLSALADTEGEIVFVGYSMGGLVTQAVLRRAEASAPHDEKIAAFLRRIRGVVLLGTPNAGSVHASLSTGFFGSLLSRPRQTLRDLTRDNPYLRDLNFWFRSYVQTSKLKVLVIREQNPVGRLGTIVSPSSADPGLGPEVQVVPVDEDHLSLSHVQSRDSDVYRLLRDFLGEPLVAPHPDTLYTDRLRAVEDAARETQEEIRTAAQELVAGQRAIVRALAGQTVQNPIVTDEAKRRLANLRQARFAAGFDAVSEARNLSRITENGDLQAASSAVRQSVYAWCSRILVTDDRGEAERLLAKAEELGQTDETVIARAFLLAYSPDGDRSAAFALLQPIGTPEALAASLMIASYREEPKIGLTWLKNAGIWIDQLNPDGKFKLLGLQLSDNDWEAARQTADGLSENDFGETPALLVLAATAYSAQAIHPDLRDVLLLPLPPSPAGFPLYETAPAMEFRAKATELYKRAAIVFTALGADKTAALASDRALWLELKDPATHATALKELQDSMADEKVRLRRVPLAVAYRLKVNVEAIEVDIDRATALSGGKSGEAIVARLVVALMKKAPELADYIEKHRADLTQYYEANYIASIEIEALAKAGRTGDARTKLAAIRSEIEDKTATVLDNLIDEAEGADPLAKREAEYTAHPSLQGLVNLVDELVDAEDHARTAHYGEKLFEELKNSASARTYVRALHEIGADDRIAAFAAAHPGLVQSSADISASVAWALYRLGRIVEAKAMLDVLRGGRDVASDRYLSMNIAIASGDWSSLNAFVESEWSHRDQREAIELLRAGTLAQRIGSAPRSQELVKEAARKANNDPHILVGAYDIASSSGWENDEDIHNWLATAIETSGEDGPVKRMDIRELLDQQPSWNERVDRTWELLLRGEAPMFVAAQSARRTLLDLTLRPALQNREQADPRKRSLVFSFAGNRPVLPVAGKRLAFDITSLLTLTVTGLLRRVLDWSESVAISHTTLSWLFEERSKLAFHQPSLVRRAREVRRLLDSGQLHAFDGNAAEPAVEHEVGHDIARYLVAAQTVDGEDAAPRTIVTPFPIHKPGSLLEETADISGFEEHFSGCADLVEALHAAGHLTETERTNALSFLQLHETPWPHGPKVRAGSTLYLDDVTVSHLQYLKLLPRLAQAGFKAFVTSDEARRADELMNFDESGEQARDAVEDLQTALRDGIASGKVTLGRLVSGDGDDEMYDAHPSRLIIAETPVVDALVIDDRLVNKFPATNSTKNATSVDVLTTMVGDGALPQNHLTQAMTRLRQSGVIFVPHLPGEIERLLNAAPIVSARVQETAELRAIRESITLVRMTDALQLPSEGEWLDNLRKELLAALKSQWQEGVTDETARARSNWALSLLDVRGWSHRAPETGADSAERYRAQILMLSMLPGSKREQRERYWNWLEDFVLRDFKHEEPQSYEELLQTVRSIVDQEVDKIETAGVLDE